MKMSTTTNEIRAKIVFEDTTSRTYSVQVDDSNINGIKTRVQEINNSTGTGAQYTAPMKSTFVSDTGSPMTKIGAVTIIQTTEDVIYGE